MPAALKRIAAIGLATALASLNLSYRFSQGRDLGHDFTAFYLAARLPLSSLYDQTALRDLGTHLLPAQGINYYSPYVRPAVFALFLRPFSWMSFRAGFMVWLILLYGCYLFALISAFRTFRLSLKYLSLFALFYGALIGPSVGQDSCFVAAVLALSYAFLAQKRDLASGAILACGLMKFNLILLVPLVFVAQSRWRAFGAFVLTGGLLAGLSVLLSPPAQYLSLLEHVRDFTGVQPALSGIRGLVVRAGLGWAYFPLVALFASATIALGRRLALETAFCAAIVASYLCGFTAAWYDAVILTAPLVAALKRDLIYTVVPAVFLILVPSGNFEGLSTAALLAIYAGLTAPAFSITQIPKPATTNVIN